MSNSQYDCIPHDTLPEQPIHKVSMEHPVEVLLVPALDVREEHNSICLVVAVVVSQHYDA